MHCLHQSRYNPTLAENTLAIRQIQNCNQKVSIDHKTFSELIRKGGFELVKVKVRACVRDAVNESILNVSLEIFSNSDLETIS